MEPIIATTQFGQVTVIPATTEFINGKSVLPSRFSSDSRPCDVSIIGGNLGSTSGLLTGVAEPEESILAK